MNVRKMKSGERKKTLRPVPALDLNGVSSEHQHDENAENSAKAVSKFHTHSIPLDMEDIERDWDKPVTEAGAFIGALLAGLLASAWRSAVHHGLLAPHLGYPRICLTVPSIVIMVPGRYMYQAMFHLGQFDTLNALDWAFRAFMVILCLPIGLAMARVITDKSWRYDI